VDLNTPVVTYVESFCESLEPEGDTVQPQNQDARTLTNLDSGEIQPLDQPVWDKDANQWLDDLIKVLEEGSLEDSMELSDLLEEMSPEEWEQLMEDTMEPFDLDDFVS